MADAKKKEKSAAQLQNEANAAEIKRNGFLNPFSKGVTYDAFNEARGKKSVAEYLKGKCSDEQVAFIEGELKAIEDRD